MYKEKELIIEELKLPGVLLIKQSVFSDDRGDIWSLYTKTLNQYFQKQNLNFQHVKFNTNSENVLRGIHFDFCSTKIVSCVSGKISQFIIDIDSSSSTFGQYEKISLKAGDGLSVLIPPGYGNAFLSRLPNTTYCYMLSYNGNYVDAGDQGTIRFNDPTFQIDWGIKAPILSERDGK